jgi:sialate O-acetylesterase
MIRSASLRLVLAASCAGVACLAAGEASAQDSTHAAALRLPRLFGDGMVLQRGVHIPVWGWAPPRVRVHVALDGADADATAGVDGRWKVTLPAHSAGGPHRLAVRAGSDSVVLHDVLVGDVWIASGQSNMELPVSAARDAAKEIAAAHDSAIRQLKVPTSWSQTPEDDIVGGAWAPADSQHVGDFSAVAYYFARSLRRSVPVPIGIVNTTWGGSRIEAWMSRAALGLDDASWRARWQHEEDEQKRRTETLRARLGGLPTVDSGLVAGRAPWADPSLDERKWLTIRTPSLWEQAGFDGMDGIAWYRTAVELTAAEAAHGATLSLGPIDDADVTWVNGVEVGRTSSYNAPRTYSVPASALRTGRNVIAVRVEDGGGGGGIWGEPSQLWLDAGAARHPLAGDWKFRVGALAIDIDGQRINKVPTVLYNRMVHPLLPFPVAGVIWYQGESNAESMGDAAEYARLFRTMITSWRREWGLGELPFLWVQLPNFMEPDSVPPAQSAWATLRESQAAALALPRTAQAVAIDVGEATDIHPKNKQDVGARLALAARKLAYHQTVHASGPTYRSHAVRGSRIVVRFDHAEAGLVSHAPDGRLGGFAISGADGKFVWADARIEGNTVVVSSPRVRAPVAVRYAWSNNPADASLFDRAGLPAAPFRTDAW